MLPVPTPFPQVGANALLIEEHQAHPVRILANGEGRGRKREVVVSIQGRDGASATKRVPVASLADPTPLTPAEQREYFRLERELTGKARPPRAAAARFERLRLRWEHEEKLRFAQHQVARDRLWKRRDERVNLAEASR